MHCSKSPARRSPRRRGRVASAARRKGFVERNDMEYVAGTCRSLRLDVGGADHLAPLLGVVRNELAELGGRGCIGLQAQIGEPHLELRAGKRLIHELIEDRDDLWGRPRRRPDPLPTPPPITRHKFPNPPNAHPPPPPFTLLPPP